MEASTTGGGAERPRTGVAGAETLIVVLGFCLLLLHNNLYYGDDFVLVLISALVLILAAIFQLVRSIFKKPPSRSLHNWKSIAAPVVLFLTFLLVQADVPRWLGWQISKSSFEATAAEFVRDPEKAHGFQGRVGLYRARGAAVDPESGAVYLITPYGTLDTAVFVLLPNGAQAQGGYMGTCHPWDGDWKICTNDLNGS